MILVIDNYDSFTYNLVQYLGELGAGVEVSHRCDRRSGDRAACARGHSDLAGTRDVDEAGVTLEVVRELLRRCRCWACASVIRRLARRSAGAWCGRRGSAWSDLAHLARRQRAVSGPAEPVSSDAVPLL